MSGITDQESQQHDYRSYKWLLIASIIVLLIAYFSNFPLLEGGGGVRLIVSFQPLMVISPTASCIRWCMQVYACELIWTCLVWAERSMLNSFCVPSHRFNEPQVSRMESLRPFILTPSRLVGCLTHYAKRQAEKHKACSFYVFDVTRSGIKPRPPAPRADTLTTMLSRGGPQHTGNIYKGYIEPIFGRLCIASNAMWIQLWESPHKVRWCRGLLGPWRCAFKCSCECFLCSGCKLLNTT